MVRDGWQTVQTQEPVDEVEGRFHPSKQVRDEDTLEFLVQKKVVEELSKE